MEEPMGPRAHLEPWAAAWLWEGLWWSPPSRSAASAATGPGRHRRQRPLHERSPLSEREERTLCDLETDLPPTSSPGAPRAPGRAMRGLVLVVALVLAAELSVGGAGAGALGPFVLLAAVFAWAWVRGGQAGPDRAPGPA